MDRDINWADIFLKKLGFTKSGDTTYLKRYSKHNNYEIKIEIDKHIEKSKIYYNPERKTTDESNPKPTGYILLGDLTTSNFKNPENFVVLEVVNRLLELGYKPENIHLERKWKLGRTGKSGKADVTVYEPSNNDNNNNNTRKTFMIIECKTWGEEFEKEKIRLFKNGGQLFSYFQQERSTKVLVLYTSTFEENEITFDNVIIRVDDESNESKKLIKKCEEKRGKDKSIPCSFSEAPDVTKLVDVWKRVYNQFVFKHGIFESDAGLYNLDLKPLKKKDLVLLKSSQGLFNAFAEILRHNNISDNANAFNKMMSLFLCKIVDEENKSDDDVLDFQVKFGESFENLVDRLQRLYKIGMEQYLDVKDFVYYSDEDIQDIIKLYPKRTKLEDIEEIFRQIKYYTNNEFAFKEIHNKELFRQNALILSEIIELLQKYRIKYSHKNQILGDFFELLLNHGVKQSEGQFFTPLPIVRFIVISVAIDKFIENKIMNNTKDIEPLPKILDYACGVAHFLTEPIDEINKMIETKQLEVKQPWEEHHIFGIEKDYRLARTAKIACFLNGDGSANIIFGDGLEDYEKLELNYKKFDFLLTNPPYSVKKFKNYLEVKPKYELFDYLTENSSEIEVLFVERTKQVLEEGGRAAIILPSSILSNTGIYSKTREIILKYFEIKAIAEFGSKTFIATGTNTVVLFLERRGDWFVKDREMIAKEIYDEKEIKNNDYIDIEKIFKSFVGYRDLPYEDYKKFVFEDIITDELNNTEIFQTHRDWFNNLTEIKNLKNRKSFKNLPEEEQKEELEKLFKEKIRDIEKEKFFYFSLMFKQGREYGDEKWYELQKIVIARAPSKTEEQKKYLGYEFNKRRGFEGIEIYGDENGKPTTKLYDDEDYDNPKKVSSYIRKNFENKLDETKSIDETIKEYVNIYNLPDLFDFESANFEKQMGLSAKKKIIIFYSSKYDLVKLKDISVIKKGTSITKEKATEGDIPVIAGGKKPAYYHNDPNRDANIITISASGANAGYVNFWDIPIFASDCNTIKGREGIAETKYIYHLLKLNQEEIFSLSRGQAQPHVYKSDLEKIKIPVPPLEIQKKIVLEIEKLENEEEKKIVLEKYL